MSVSPRIGVVIPVFHGADDLRQTLKAFRALPTHVLTQLEVVVADGASTDDTLNVMSTFMDVIRHADSRDDLGVYDAMNRGADLVQAPYVWFLGAGDLPLAEGLFTLLERLEGDVGHACTVLAMAPREPGVPAEFVPQFGKSLDWRNTLHHQGVVVPTAWVKQRPLSTEYKVLSDYAWMLDCRNAGQHIECHPELVLASVAGGGLSRNFDAALYKEERRMKHGRISRATALAHWVWLPAKWAFKQVSKARSI